MEVILFFFFMFVFLFYVLMGDNIALVYDRLMEMEMEMKMG